MFKGNTCSGGCVFTPSTSHDFIAETDILRHGISIGSISDAKTVSGVTISSNTVTESMYGIRIKVKAYASLFVHTLRP